LLEHPAEAFVFYRREGVSRVICEQKHMGSRAVVIVSRDEDAARQRFGVIGESGVIYTRTGRRFFEDRQLEIEILGEIRAAFTKADLWTELSTDWVCLDCELMPWSAKAQELLRHQYGAVGAASQAALAQVVTALEQALARGIEVASLLDASRKRLGMAVQYVEAYRHYCWPVQSLSDLKIAPFHLLAAEGRTFTDKGHIWHMNTLAKLCAKSDLLLATTFLTADLANDESEAHATRWWEELTGNGGEGMVVKPIDFIAKGRRGVTQPAVKCRGREYLRIIYGPEYTAPANLDRLRSRGVSAKRSLALREFALGIEALERFVAREPLRRVHECVFGIFALESEPVDPRL